MKKNVNKKDIKYMCYFYDREKGKYVWKILPFVVHYEYWSYWVKGENRKMKITSVAPRQIFDSYGWSCYRVIEVCTCWKLDRYRIIKL